MEAIKCPNCGSENVKELTEEKYACLACDNIFLVHNLSKEFRQTDAHITDMHEDRCAFFNFITWIFQMGCSYNSSNMGMALNCISGKMG